MKYCTKGWITTLLCLCVACILFFGLRPKNYSLFNKIYRLDDKPGVQFNRYGLAYTMLPYQENGMGATGELTVELVIDAMKTTDNSFQAILMLHNGSDASQMTVGQWCSSLIAMNGNDYDHMNNHPRIYREDALTFHGPQMFTITADRSGTRLYKNGELIKEEKAFRLTFPCGNHPTALIIGNDVFGKRGWIGRLNGLAIYPTALQEKGIAEHFHQWMRCGDFNFEKQAAPLVLYDFKEASGDTIFDQSINSHDLKLPLYRNFIKKQILLIPWVDFRPDRSDGVDAVVNLIGFLPLGFLLMAAFSQNIGGSQRYLGLLAVGLCFALSLQIEFIQSYLPSRSSEISDIASNTLGGFFGFVIWKRLKKIIHYLGSLHLI